MLVLTNHQSHQEETFVKEVLSHARSLRERIRVNQFQGDQLAKDCDSFSQEIAQLLIDSKKAA